MWYPVEDSSIEEVTRAIVDSKVGCVTTRCLHSLELYDNKISLLNNSRNLSVVTNKMVGAFFSISIFIGHLIHAAITTESRVDFNFFSKAAVVDYFILFYQTGLHRRYVR